MKQMAVFASGSGSNFESLVKFWQDSAEAAVRLLICDQPGAYCLQRAESLGIPAFVGQPRQHGGKAAYEAWILQILQEQQIDFVVLAGYMRLVGPQLLAAYSERIVNIHPALLPSFPGKHAVEQALASGVQVSGVTIHVVDAGMDTGPILYQEAVPVSSSDGPADLQARIARVEHRAYPRVVAAYLAGDVVLEGRRAIWQPEALRCVQEGRKEHAPCS